LKPFCRSGNKIKNIIVPGTRAQTGGPQPEEMFANIGFYNVSEIDEMETIRFEGATITGVPFTGEHSDLNILTKSCHLVQIGGFKLLFMADSRIMEPALYRHIHAQTGDAALFSWVWNAMGAFVLAIRPLVYQEDTKGPEWQPEIVRFGLRKGMSLIEIFQPKETYVYAMGRTLAGIYQQHQIHRRVQPIVQSTSWWSFAGNGASSPSAVRGKRDPV